RYVYPQDDEVWGAPWGALLGSIGEHPDLVLASVLPHVGAQLRGETAAAAVSWPWSVPFGPAFTSSRTRGSFTVRDHLAHRALLEPGVFSSPKGVGFYLRPGYRFIYHPSDWVLGLGGGAGTSAEITKAEPFRIGFGPEVILHFGHCC